jgi:hypothetical protein
LQGSSGCTASSGNFKQLHINCSSSHTTQHNIHYNRLLLQMCWQCHELSFTAVWPSGLTPNMFNSKYHLV